MFKFFSGGLKGLIEAILFKILGVEPNAKIEHKKQLQKKK